MNHEQKNQRIPQGFDYTSNLARARREQARAVSQAVHSLMNRVGRLFKH